MEQLQCPLAHRAERRLGHDGGLERFFLRHAGGVREGRMRVDDIT